MNHPSPEFLSEFDYQPGALPLLPSNVRYWDDFEECIRTIQEFPTAEMISVRCDGRTIAWSLAEFSEEHRILIKHAFAVQISSVSANAVRSTMGSLFSILNKLGPSALSLMAWLSPSKLKEMWELHFFEKMVGLEEANALKRVLHAFCAHNVGQWRPEHWNFVSTLRAPKQDPYRSVRSGECFVPSQHLQRLYAFFDDLAEKIEQGHTIAPAALRAASIVLLIEQHGFRPGS